MQVQKRKKSCGTNMRDEIEVCKLSRFMYMGFQDVNNLQPKVSHQIHIQIEAPMDVHQQT